jgi:hypothetical protein|tara:strand:+ start:944 stop:1714 length:771 start_codon:yes stop_codon:yes gene_type:complete
MSKKSDEQAKEIIAAASITHSEIWKKMSTIDVTEYTKSRGVGKRTLSWIPWSDCLAILQAHYPEFEYHFTPVQLYPDGSAEVGCTVSIGAVSRTVDLPVMDNRFDAIVAGPDSSPSSRDINDGRWRAFVKCVAVLTGLGFQLYRDGKGVPVPVRITHVKPSKAPKPLTTAQKKKQAEAEAKLKEAEEEAVQRLVLKADKILAERVELLEGLLSACEEHGGVDEKVLNLGRKLIEAGGPLDRVEKGIKHLEGVIGRV